MIYDCFLFFNELDLLDLRLRVLGPVVDKFVLVEAPRTIQGRPKAMVFKENEAAFKEYDIIRVVVDDLPLPSGSLTPMMVEHFQRNAIRRGLTDAHSSDRFMVSDVDEIPNPLAVQRQAASQVLVGFPMSLHYYYVNCRQEQPWWGTVMAPVGTLLTPQDMREMRCHCPAKAAEVGWHFSFLGGVNRIREKLAAFSEAQVNTPENSDPEHLRRCLETGEDMFCRRDPQYQKRFVELDETYPPEMQEWLEKYPYTVHQVSR